MTSSSPGEIPDWAEDVSQIVREELDATRVIITRLLAVSDALLAASLTVAGVFVGAAAASDSPWVAVVAGMVVLGLAYLEAQTWVSFRRMTVRSRELERLYQTYVSMVQESPAARRGAVRTFKGAVRRYRFGIERQFRPPEFEDIKRANKDRLTPRLLGGLGLLLFAIAVAIGVTGGNDGADPTCVRTADGTVLKVSIKATVVGGGGTVVSCEGPLRPTDGPTPATPSGMHHP